MNTKITSDLITWIVIPLTFCWINVLVAADVNFEVPLGQRQLFLDDFGIQETHNLQHTLHQPQKQGAVIRPDKFKGEEAVQIRGVPTWDPEKNIYKLWLSGTQAPYRESLDGLHWTAMPHSTSGSSMMVRDPNERDPNRRFKAVALSSGFLVSPDAISWTKLDIPAIPGSDEGNFSYDPKEGLFIHSYKCGGPHGRSVGVATSTDFQEWTNHGLVFHADDEDQIIGKQRIQARFADPHFHHPAYDIPATYNIDVYNMAMFRYESLYIGLPQIYHKTGQVPPNWPGFDELPISDEMLVNYHRDGDWAGFHDVQLTCSRDLKNWQRLANREPFMTASPLGGGAWDECSLGAPSYPLVRGNELWFYYTSARYYGPVLMDQSGRHLPSNAISLSILRRDGFMSLDAGESAGTLLTRRFTVPGETLKVNVDARQGELEIEVLDEQGNTLATSDVIRSNLPAGQVSWKQGDLANAHGKAGSLRFTLRNASLYSYWFE